MSEQEFEEVSEAQIAVHWEEEENFHPSRFIAQANLLRPDTVHSSEGEARNGTSSQRRDGWSSGAPVSA